MAGMIRCALLVVSVLLCGRSVLHAEGAALQEKPAIPIKIDWKYKNLKRSMRIYELKPDNSAELWETEVSTDAAALPISEEIKDSTIRLRPGSQKYFALIYKNETAQSVDFFAAPHQVDPPEAALGLEFWCLCLGQSYHVKPRGIWYRVVRLTLSDAFTEGSASITHMLIAGKSSSKTPLGHHH